MRKRGGRKTGQQTSPTLGTSKGNKQLVAAGNETRVGASIALRVATASEYRYERQRRLGRVDWHQPLSNGTDMV